MMSGPLTIGLLLLSLILLHIALEWWRAFRIGRSASASPSTMHPANDAPLPSVSVLVPAWSEASTIADCLRALREVEYPDWEVIVIAGGPDGTYEAVERLPRLERLTLIAQRAAGKNAALNQGLALARGEVIVVLDADTLVGPQWLSRLVRPLTNGVDATYGNYLPLKRTWVSQSEEMEKIAACLIRKQYILQGSGSIAVRRLPLEQIGGFPEAITIGVDWDLSARLASAGRRTYFVEDARVWTHRPATLLDFWKNEVRWRRAHLRWILRREHRPSWVNALSGGRIYLSILGLGLGFALGLAALIVQRSDLAGLAFAGACLMLGWAAGRRAALAGQVAGYTGDRRWLALAWSLAMLLIVTFIASGWAALTLRRRTIHFKGPR